MPDSPQTQATAAGDTTATPPAVTPPASDSGKDKGGDDSLLRQVMKLKDKYQKLSGELTDEKAKREAAEKAAKDASDKAGLTAEAMEALAKLEAANNAAKAELTAANTAVQALLDSQLAQLSEDAAGAVKAMPGSATDKLNWLAKHGSLFGGAKQAPAQQQKPPVPPNGTQARGAAAATDEIKRLQKETASGDRQARAKLFGLAFGAKQ